MSEIRSATFFCAKCGEVAGSLELLPSPTSPSLRVEGPAAQSLMRISPQLAARLDEALTVGTPGALYTLSFEYAPSYCPECKLCYCHQCWELETVFDEDFAGFYDCTYGICPHGHRCLVDD